MTETTKTDALPVDGASEVDVRDTRPSSSVEFTIKEAADACACDRRTITRKMDKLEENGAYKDSSGIWKIPLTALFAADLKPGSPAGPDKAPQAALPGAVSHEVEILRLQIESEKLRAAAFTAKADGLERALEQAIARAVFAETQILAIEAGPTTPVKRYWWGGKKKK